MHYLSLVHTAHVAHMASKEETAPLLPAVQPAPLSAAVQPATQLAAVQQVNKLDVAQRHEQTLAIFAPHKEDLRPKHARLLGQI